jgi:exodeoxyribonuclease VII small subunit
LLVLNFIKNQEGGVVGKETKQEMSFEEALERLEKLVAQMEGGELGLEEMLACFEEGSSLVTLCSSKLDEVEQRIEKLVKKDGALKEVAFDSETEE